MATLAACLAVAVPPLVDRSGPRRGAPQPAGWAFTAGVQAPGGPAPLGFWGGGPWGAATSWAAVLRLDPPRLGTGPGAVHPQVGLLLAHRRMAWGLGDMGRLRPAWAWGWGYRGAGHPAVARGAALWWLVAPGTAAGLLAHVAVGAPVPRHRLRLGSHHGPTRQHLLVEGAIMGRGMAGAHRLRLVTRGGLRPGGGARRSRPLQLRGQVALLGDAQLGAGSLRWLVALRPVGPTASLALTAQSLSYALTYRASGRGGDLELGMRQRHLRLVLGARVAVPTSMGGSPRPMRLILWGAAAPRAMGLRAQVDLWRHAQGQAGATPALRLGGPLLGARAAQLWGHGALSWALPQNLLRAQGRLKLRRGRATVHLVAGADWPLGSDPRRRMRPRWGALGTIECFYEL